MTGANPSSICLNFHLNSSSRDKCLSFVNGIVCPLADEMRRTHLYYIYLKILQGFSNTNSVLYLLPYSIHFRFANLPPVSITPGLRNLASRGCKKRKICFLVTIAIRSRQLFPNKRQFTLKAENLVRKNCYR